ncbi:MAG: hypothetical protein OSB65_05750 [Roseibacillus sp.]|nr:hypothetical protein [Roseibacillus sp.]
MTTYQVLLLLLLLAGVGQFVLCAASPFIPLILKWPAQLRALPTLLRQVFWTYAAYILCTHLIFAAISVFAARWLLDGSVMATIMAGFIALWWGARFVIHLIGFETAEVPDEGWHLVAKRALGLLFVSLATVYVLAVCFNLGVLP